MQHYRTFREDVSFISMALYFIVLALVAHPRPCQAEEASRAFTLKSSIEYALRHSSQILASKEGVATAEANKKKQFSEFLPKLSANYTYTRSDEEKRGSTGAITSPENLYNFTATITQPVFSGFSRFTQYKISALGLDTARLLERQSRQGLILKVKDAYFEILQAEKLEKVARQAVTQLAAHARVAGNFYEVGMTPKNDLLKAEVELANAKQDLVVAQNNAQVAMSRFNTLLKRPVDTPVAIEDVMTYEPFTGAYEDCVQTALKQRAGIQVADLGVKTAEKDVKLAQKGYYPSIDLRANYYSNGDNPGLDGGDGIADTDEWDFVATASWTFWEWGKTRYGVKEKLSRLAQAKHNRSEIIDSVRQEVKEAYLRVKESEQNILTVQKAVEQAMENFRMSEERYKEQVATSTEVLDAQTLLTKTQTNYLNALSAFNISKAELNRAIGLEVVDRP